MSRSLRVTTCGVLPTVSIPGDGDEAALVVADDEGLSGVSAGIDLTGHHLLHGEIADGTANSSNLMPRFSSSPI